MTAACFVDANIFVYAHNPAEALKCGVARELLLQLWTTMSGRTSVQALNEFYVVVTRKLSKRLGADEAWAEVEEYLRWSPCPVDAELVKRAHQLEGRFKVSWWDCLILAAAQMQGCSVLYSEDLQHGGVYDGVRVVNPFLSRIQEESASYRVQPVSQHRPRGRPRKQATA